VQKLPISPDRTQMHTTLHMTPIDANLDSGRDVYLHITQHSQDEDITPLAELKPAVPASEQLQTHALDRAATGAILGNYARRIWKKLPNNLY